jgi:hypothetical protein
MCTSVRLAHSGTAWDWSMPPHHSELGQSISLLSYLFLLQALSKLADSIYYISRYWKTPRLVKETGF